MGAVMLGRLASFRCGSGSGLGRRVTGLTEGCRIRTVFPRPPGRWTRLGVVGESGPEGCACRIVKVRAGPTALI
jgi:hypothetical protein